VCVRFNFPYSLIFVKACCFKSSLVNNGLFTSSPLFWRQSEGLVLHRSCCSLSEGFGSHCGHVWLKKGKESEMLVVVPSVLNANRWLVVNLSHWHLAGNWMLGRLCTTGCLWQAMQSITKRPHNIIVENKK